MRLIKPYYEIESEINGELILKHLERAARICYKSEHQIGDFEKTKKFISGLIKRGHESTIEHYSLSVRFIVDRGVTHELVRHRLVAYSQESTRYCNYSKDEFSGHVTYIIPPWLNLEEGIYRVDPYKNKFYVDEVEICPPPDGRNWLSSLAESEMTYLNLIEHSGWSPQQARSVLPNSLKTEIVASANLREWRHIFKMRAQGIAGKPHPQMREIMVPLLKDIQSKIPVVFDDIIVG